MIRPFYTILTLRTRHEGIRLRSWTVPRSKGVRSGAPWRSSLCGQCGSHPCAKDGQGWGTPSTAAAKAVGFGALNRSAESAAPPKGTTLTYEPKARKAPLFEISSGALVLLSAFCRRGRRRYAISTFRPCRRRRARRRASELPSFPECPLPGLRWSTSARRSNRRWSVRCALPWSDRARLP